MSQLSVALDGSGFGARVLLPAWLSHPGYRVVGLVGATRQSRGVAAAEHHHLPFYDTLDALYHAAGPIDLVIVATPPGSHRTFAEEAMRHGSHVLTEKPMGLHLADAEAMLATALATGRQGFIDFEFRSMAGRRALREALQADRMGGLLSFQWMMGGSGYQSYARRQTGWITQPALGGGYLNAIGPHLIDYIQWALGDIAAVSAELVVDVAERVDGVNEAEDGFTILMRMKDGATGVLHYRSASRVRFPASLEVTGRIAGFRLEGDEALWAFAGDSSELVPVDTGPGPSHAHASPEAVGAQWMAEQVYRALTDAPHEAPTFADGIKVQRVLDAIRAAHQTGLRSATV